jgi:ribose 5-phosphate isomerase B
MKIVIGSDHRGFAAKQRLGQLLRQLGHEVLDVGPHSEGSVDYPDFGLPAARLIASGQARCGVLLCCTGIGMCITANKVPGIRAALCHDQFTTEMSRRHNDANVLCLAADLLGDELVDRMVRIWLETPFEGGRHARRVEKIGRIEREGK